MKSTWKKYLLFAAYILVGVGLLYGLLQTILAGYSAPWTGFGERALSNGDIVGEKTLWDWMELLIIPLVLALGAFFLNRSERALERKTAEDRAKLERDLATDRQQEAALQTYFDCMSELLLKEKLRTSRNKEVRNVARTRTLTVLRGLDPTRKRLVIQFLYEAGLIAKNKTVVDISGADFDEANLFSAHLEGANLMGVNFGGAILAAANLKDANLYVAYLMDADLRLVDLEGANLKAANVEDEQLSTAKSLKGATMPDGTIHE